jgi:hypothetical protein
VIELKTVAHGGTHAPTRLRSRLEHTNRSAGSMQIDGRHEAGNAGADNHNGRLGHGHGEINAAAPVGAPDAG